MALTLTAWGFSVINMLVQATPGCFLECTMCPRAVMGRYSPSSAASSMAASMRPLQSLCRPCSGYAHRHLWCVLSTVSRCEDTHLALVLAPWWFPCCHLDHCACHAPDVGLAPMAVLLDDLRRHPVGCSLDALLPRVCNHMWLVDLDNMQLECLWLTAEALQRNFWHRLSHRAPFILRGRTCNRDN